MPTFSPFHPLARAIDHCKAHWASDLHQHMPHHVTGIMLCGPLPEQRDNCPRVLLPGCPVVSQGILLLSNSTEVGTNSKATRTTPHSHLNTHLGLMTLDLLYH